ncbi:MAG: diacylglycerol kinase family protein [Achromobacter sp.]|uniref:diacylglycerol kinase family protein n=1 Tax=Achromobacter sp. TaxID=134375 RepID=UPI00259023E1|nr:diacylglycerol kinase family protein [Achromobacter sp.]MCW0210947.1 diacylglycerol kinase family protein [Achromobacter sp.]
MTRVGLIVNPRSRHNRSGDFRRRAAAFADLPQAEPRTTTELTEVLTDFRRRGVRVVAVSGGDGTLREVLTALPAAYGGEAPDIALLPAGKTDLAARVVGRAGQGAAGLRRLLDAARRGALTRVEWPVLEIAWRDAPERRVRGFLFGAAGFTTGTRIANSHVHRAGFYNATAVALSIAATAAATLFGSRRHALLEGEEMIVGVDGAPRRGGRHFLTMATTLDRLVLGLTPFWGEGDKPVRWLDVPAKPPRLMAALLPTLRGRPRPWMIDAGYASGRADEMVVETAQPFVVDGELFEPGARGIRLSARQRVGFVTP